VIEALRMVVRAPWFALAIAIGEIAIAAAVGTVVRAAADAALDGAGPPDDHVLAALVELALDSPAVPAANLTALGIAVAGGVLAHVVLSGLVIARMAGPAPAGQLASTWVRSLVGVIATSGWHLLIRAAALVVAVMIATSLPPVIGAVVLAAALGLCAVALDLARVRVVLEDAGGTHPRVAWRGLVDAVKHPAIGARAGALALVQWLLVPLAAYVAIAGLGQASTLAWVRALALVGVVLGLWRVALVVRWARAQGGTAGAPG
jgi:hypothetical protein